jgi:NAD(P)-dependent dehydrogenase (short-subunit alcohol dehydrogenase family)
MKTCLITGAARGIGYAIAKIFNEEGYKVFAVDKDPVVSSFPSSIIFEKIDVRDEEAVKALIEHLPKIDILINNAAIQYEKPYSQTSAKEFKNVVDTNLVGTFIVTKIVSSIMKKGLVINVGSVHSTLPRKNKMAYDASKAGLRILTQEFALELAIQGIRVNAIEFGAVDTPMNADSLKDNREKIAERVLMGHIFRPKEIATAIYRLASDDFQYMNGSIVVYDAGRSLL